MKIDSLDQTLVLVMLTVSLLFGGFIALMGALTHSENSQYIDCVERIIAAGAEPHEAKEVCS